MTDLTIHSDVFDFNARKSDNLGKPCINEYESNLHNMLILRITPLTSRAGTRLTPPSNEIFTGK